MDIKGKEVKKIETLDDILLEFLFNAYRGNISEVFPEKGEGPLYIFLLNKLTKEEVNDPLMTAAVTIKEGKIVMLINTKKMAQESKEMRMGTIKHELLHLIRKHLLRQGSRRKKVTIPAPVVNEKGEVVGMQPQEVSIWNLAADAAINQNIPLFNKKEAKTVNIHNLDLPENKSSEEYYNILVKRIQGNQGKGKGKKGGGGSGDDKSEVMGTANDLMPGGGEISENLKKALQDMAKKHSEWEKAEKNGDLSYADVLIDKAVKDAIRDYVRYAGYLPGNIEELVKDYIDTGINPAELLSGFIRRGAKRNRNMTWYKVNRRFGDKLPGFKRKKMLKLVITVDTSGSMSRDDLAAAASIIEDTLALVPCETVVLHNDTEVVKEIKLKSMRDLQTSGYRSFKGRGGTKFKPVFDYIEKNRIRPDVMLFITDLYNYDEGQVKKPRFPVIFLAPKKKHKGETPFPAPIVEYETEKVLKD